MIELHDVTVCYEKKRRHLVPSLDKVSLTIGQGELVFLVGPSGAGKSSLLKLLYAGVRPDLGRVLVDGQDISRLASRDIPALRRKIGVVFQDFQLLAEKTAWENVAFALRVIGVPNQVILREVPRALETVGIDHRAHAYPHELSGGEQQRVAIARAIVNDPVLLLADEPTGNLDPDTADQIGDLLAKINRERGTTVVLVTHDRELVDSMRRRVVRLKDGHVVADDNPGVYHAEDLEPDLAAALTAEIPTPAGPSGPVGMPPLESTVVPPRAVARTSGQRVGSPGAHEQAPQAAGAMSESLAGPEVEPGGRDSPVPQTLENIAPLGSPENPIVSYDR